MGEFVIKLPDVGEGVAEAELVEWTIEDGSLVKEDQVLAAVMTDKATVEIPSPVEGKVIWRAAKVGDIVAVGSALVRLEVEGAGNVKSGGEAMPEEAAAKSASQSAQAEPSAVKAAEAPKRPANPEPTTINKPRAGASLSSVTRRAEGEKPLASPAVRKRALDNGVDLRQVMGSGPAGRVTHEDLDGFFQSGSGIAIRPGRGPDTSVKDIAVIGLRRKIAEKMATSKSRIPHITYVDEVDITALEELRAALNAARRPDQPKLTILPFLMRAMARAIERQPQFNAIYDDNENVIHQYGGMHMGVATQTEGGLIVPVVRHVEAMSVWECASEVGRLSESCRKGTATRDELSGSTITITSLGAMGGLVTTPVINYPEVAIIGVNKMQVLPHWDGTQFVPRKKMNLSSSFDHRVIDGWDCAVFIQAIKSMLENPAMIFIEG
jgi:2-oxoisovalerate dehydrogenase E2 component (dihydrolipoyl transacylase)